MQSDSSPLSKMNSILPLSLQAKGFDVDFKCVSSANRNAESDLSPLFPSKVGSAHRQAEKNKNDLKTRGQWILRRDLQESNVHLNKIIDAVYLNKIRRQCNSESDELSTEEETQETTSQKKK